MIERIVEPQSMDDIEQANAYFDADREAYKYMFKIAYSTAKTLPPINIIDVGCGNGDLTKAIAELYDYSVPVTGIDTSAEMLAHAPTAKNLTFKQQSISDAGKYDRLISSLALHHFHDPMQFWNGVKNIAPRDIFVIDLLRPNSEERLQELVQNKECSDCFRKDFENSLRAAFTLDEINTQLAQANLSFDVFEVDQYNLGMDLVLIAGMV
jgi:trans-aconitate methyltransferase